MVMESGESVNSARGASVRRMLAVVSRRALLRVVLEALVQTKMWSP